eukprot:CAMPEP_0174726750 /NCGR_PEP_ID=MMETSP1094-20130205/48445_1 /TAXON_ID=156173 /ORGANISM="Chrysochromulina brevifilum, Strain UTEX LB 985" /LENGTH=97 /DNA_ID=CAMNT_0015928373 /DNA_START=253 /DNA_END=547 /DNA_ORIENTATION=+
MAELSSTSPLRKSGHPAQPSSLYTSSADLERRGSASLHLLSIVANRLQLSYALLVPTAVPQQTEGSAVGAIVPSSTTVPSAEHDRAAIGPHHPYLVS